MTKNSDIQKLKSTVELPSNGVPSSENELMSAQVSRRTVAAMLGAIAAGTGAAALSGCQPGATGPEFGGLTRAATGTSIWWGSTIGVDLVSHVGVDDGEIAVVHGYWSEGDGGGGLFCWDSSLGAADEDFGTIIGASSNPPNIEGCWKRIYSGPLNIKWFGADSGGTNDSRERIQSALDKGDIYIPEGTFLIDTSLYVPSNRIISGAGSKSILKQMEVTPNWEYRVLMIENVSNVVVQSIAIDGGFFGWQSSEAPDVQRHNMVVTGSENIRIQGVDSYNAPGDGILIHSSATHRSKNVRVRDCNFYNRGRCSISITGYGADDVQITGCHCSLGIGTPSAAPNNAGIDLESVGVSTNVQITDNYVFEGPIESTTGGTWKNLIISNNHIDMGSVSHNIAMVVYNAINVEITNNFLRYDPSASGKGIGVSDTGIQGDSGFTIIRGNVVQNISGANNYAIACFTQSSDPAVPRGNYIIDSNIIDQVDDIGIKVQQINDVNICDNIIKNVGSMGIHVFNCMGFIISSNNLHNAGSNGGICLNNTLSQYPTSKGVVASNVVTYDDPTNKQGIHLGTGHVENVLCHGNYLKDAADQARSLYIYGSPTMTSVYGRDNMVAGPDEVIESDCSGTSCTAWQPVWS